LYHRFNKIKEMANKIKWFIILFLYYNQKI
jgi:hypothetical protein